MEEEIVGGDTSCCSTPFVSAPSSPSRAAAISHGFYYSAPTSPMHFLLNSTNATLINPYPYPYPYPSSSDPSFEFDFSSNGSASASSADELFTNGQIRPIKPSTRDLNRPPLLLSPLIEFEESESRGRELKTRAGSLRRRTRSMSPIRNNNNNVNTTSFHNELDNDNNININVPNVETTSSSKSKRWVFFKELLLYRSKSEGQGRNIKEAGHNRFWNTLSFSNLKEKKLMTTTNNSNGTKVINYSKKGGSSGKRRSAHELHYAAKRAEAEEMRKKTFLPYRQGAGLFGCLGFTSKSYGTAMNSGFARAFNPGVSSR